MLKPVESAFEIYGTIRQGDGDHDEAIECVMENCDLELCGAESAVVAQMIDNYKKGVSEGRRMSSFDDHVSFFERSARNSSDRELAQNRRFLAGCLRIAMSEHVRPN